MKTATVIIYPDHKVIVEWGVMAPEGSLKIGEAPRYKLYRSDRRFPPAIVEGEIRECSLRLILPRDASKTPFYVLAAPPEGGEPGMVVHVIAPPNATIKGADETKVVGNGRSPESTEVLAIVPEGGTIIVKARPTHPHALVLIKLQDGGFTTEEL